MKQEQILELAEQSGFYVKSREIFTPKLEHLPINEAVEKLIFLVEQSTLERATLRCESKLREILQEYSKDSKRLMFACEFDGYTTVEKDRYDYAIESMKENGRDEANEEDELNGLRRLIDAAMKEKK